jgi:hypothetical protein
MAGASPPCKSGFFRVGSSTFGSTQSVIAHCEFGEAVSIVLGVIFSARF